MTPARRSLNYHLRIVTSLSLLLQPVTASAFILSFGSAGATTGDQKIYINKLMDEFRAAHPDAKVEVRDSTSYVKPILETLMSNLGEAAPDLAVVGLVEWPVLYKKKLLRPYDSILSEGELKKIWATFRPELTVQHYGKEVDHRKLALPFNRAIPVAFINEQLLPGIGEQSITWEQLEDRLRERAIKTPELAQTLKISIPTDDWIAESIMLNARGSSTLRGQVAQLDDAKSFERVQWLRTMVKKKSVELVPSQNRAYLDFIDKRAAVALLSVGTLKSIEARASFKFRVVMPPDAGTRLTVLGGGDLILPAESTGKLDEKKKSDIKKFLLWFYLGKGSVRWATLTGFLQTRKGGPVSVYERQKWRISSFYELDEYCNIIPMRDAYQRAFREALSSEDPKPVLGQAAKFVTEMFTRPCP